MWNRRSIVACIVAMVTPAKAEEISPYQDALERIALLDEADGHELTVKHAFMAVAIAANTLGKHPSQIFAERYARTHARTCGAPTEKQ